MNNYKLIITISFFITFLSFSLANNLCAQTKDVEVLYFDSDTESIGPRNKEKVQDRVSSLKNTSEFTIILEGYSDITGRADYNLKLSRERAQLVKDYLVGLGIDPDKIEVIGKGGTEKYGVGETNETLAQNRRVNLIVEIPAEPVLKEENPETQVIPQDEPLENIQKDQTEAAEEVEPQISNIKLDDISEKIESAIRQSASKGISFSTPQEMKSGESYTVEAEVSYSFIEGLSKGLDGFKLGDQIGLALVGSGLDIFDEGLHIKTIEKDSPSKWQWQVTPKTQGIKSLILSVAISSESVVLDDNYPTFRRIIDVKPNMIHSITSSYWVMGVLIVLIIFLVGWILIRKVRVN